MEAIIIIIAVIIIASITGGVKIVDEKKEKALNEKLESSLKSMRENLELLKTIPDESKRQEMFKLLDADLKEAKDLFYKVHGYEY